MNKLGSMLYRVTNIGFLTLANLLASLVMAEEMFGAFYTVMAGVALTISICDVFNAKYMVNIFGQDHESWPQIFPTRLFSAVLCGLTMAALMALFGYGAGAVWLAGLFAAMMLFNSGLLTLFYCRPKEQRVILWSSLLGGLVALCVAATVVKLPLSLPMALLVLTGYKAAETGYLLIKLRPGRGMLPTGLYSITAAFANFPRLTFYLQNILSVVGGRLHAFVLPLLLNPAEFGLLGQAATLLAVYIFLMTYLGMDIFRLASGVGLEQVDWRQHAVRIAVSLAAFSGLLLTSVPWLYPELTPYVPFLIALTVVVSFSSQQGYLLFLVGMDRWILYLSVGTPLVSVLALTMLAQWLGLVGALLAMILVELLSVLTVACLLWRPLRSAFLMSRGT